MTKPSWMLVLAGVVFAAAGLYVGRNCSLATGCDAGTAIHSVREPKDWANKPRGTDLRSLAPDAAICVNPVKNLSDQPVDMEHVDELLASEIAKTGYRAAKIGDLACDATAYTEIVHVSNGQRVQAELEFRLVFAGEQAPRFSATAKGQSESAELLQSDSSDPSRARDAILAAFADQARKIQLAQRQGMAPYAGVQQP
ncbi:MAG TPA: hypothetical protein VK419_11815 [Bryobacteraceae bacterium]|nr:hypothetical protein [Bryobacteraceae bacterium]